MKFQNGDFFDSYPELAYKLPFRTLKNKFNKKEASELCWYVYLYSSLDSEFRTFPPDKRREELETHFLKREVHELPEVQTALEEYDNNMISLAKRNFKKWEDKLTERQQFIDETPYTVSTFDMLDKLMASTSKMWDMFLKLKAELDKEDEESKVYGGVELSDSEKGLI
jgi:hypothetical protein